MGSKEDLRNYQLQLDQVNDGLSLAPDDPELLELKEGLVDLITLLKEQLETEEAEQETKQRKWQQKKAIIPSQAPPKTASPIKSNGEEGAHSPEPPSREKPEYTIFKVGDVVSAKWASGDGGYYPAKVTQVTGSSHLPYYTVQFIKWDDTMQTLPAYSVKALAEDKKRKVTATGFDKPPPPKKIDPQAKEAAEEKKRRRLKEKQDAEKDKQNWQRFATQGPKKRAGAVGKAVPIGTNSMFKTPETHTGRGNFSFWFVANIVVGVVGSGKGMTEHLGRVKHKFQKVKLLDED